jgi:hypothetical protein
MPAPNRDKNCTEEKKKWKMLHDRHAMLAKAHQNDKTENVSRRTIEATWKVKRVLYSRGQKKNKDSETT